MNLLKPPQRKAVQAGSSTQTSVPPNTSFSRCFIAVVFLLATVISLQIPKATAQTTSGIRGRVTDASGAVVPKAMVVVHNQRTGVDKQSQTTGSCWIRV